MAGPAAWGALDQASGLLPTDPPARAARWAGWLLLSLALTVGLFVALVPLPESVRAPVRLMPVEGSAPVRAPVAGILIGAPLRVGQSVRAGELLFALDSLATREAQQQQATLEAEAAALQARRQAREAALARRLALLASESALATRELHERDVHDAAVRALLARKQEAVDQGLLAAVTLVEDRLRAADAAQQRLQAAQRVQQLALNRETAEAERATEAIAEQAEQARLQAALTAAQAQLARADGGVEQIRAQRDAVVMETAALEPGAVVEAGMLLAQLAPRSVTLQADITLPQAALARIRVDQPVRLYLQAYPHLRHGSVPARIRWVSPAATADEADSFRVLATLESMPAGINVRPGLIGEARILVERRTLLARALEPLSGLRDWLWY